MSNDYFQNCTQFLISDAFNLIVYIFYFSGQGNIFRTFKCSTLNAPISSFLFEPTIFRQTFTYYFFKFFLIFHQLDEVDWFFLFFWKFSFSVFSHSIRLSKFFAYSLLNFFSFSFNSEGNEFQFFFIFLKFLYQLKILEVNPHPQQTVQRRKQMKDISDNNKTESDINNIVTVNNNQNINDDNEQERKNGVNFENQLSKKKFVSALSEQSTKAKWKEWSRQQMRKASDINV